MSSFSAGSITGFLGLDISGFTGGMIKAESIMSLFPEAVTSFMANPLLGLVDIAKEAGTAVAEILGKITEDYHHLGLEAAKIGVSVEFMRDVGGAAKESGSFVEGLADAMRFLNHSTGEALSGNQTVITDFRRLGITINELRTLTPEQMFYRVADAMSHVSSVAEKTQIAMGILGRGGSESIAFLSQGSDKIREIAQSVRDAHGNSAEELAKWSVNWSKLGAEATNTWEGVKEELMKPIMQYASEHAEELGQTIKDIGGDLRQAATEWGPVLLDVFKELASLMKTVHENFEGVKAGLEGLPVYYGLKLYHYIKGDQEGGDGGGGVGASRGSSSGPPTVNVNVNARGMSDDQTARATGRAVTGEMMREFKRQQRETNGRILAERVRGGL